jgi:carbon monoxide dehydrogenase subunit G
MRVSGAGTLHAPAEVVRAALTDRDVLVRAIPGIERLDVTGSGRWEFTMTTAIAAVRGTYVGAAAVRQADAPSVLGLHVSAAGARGTIRADVVMRLAQAADGTTEVSYEADAEVAGPIAGIGQRMLASIAGRLAGDFLGGLDRVVAAPPAAARPADVAGKRAGESVIDLARCGIGLRGKPVPAPDQQGSAVRTGLLAGAVVGLAGILIGALLGRRNRAPRRGGASGRGGR